MFTRMATVARLLLVVVTLAGWAMVALPFDELLRQSNADCGLTLELPRGEPDDPCHLPMAGGS